MTMRIWPLFLILIAIGFSSSGWAQSCPTAKSLKYLPVHDQDGMGTCSANTAALMMQYNLGLPKSPSYIQMSITESSRAESFFYTDKQNKERIFNWGANICDVARESAQHGFCDFDQMGFDFVGRMDNTGAQQSFLVKVARFLEAKESDIRQLRALLVTPATRAQALRRLAYFFNDTPAELQALDRFLNAPTCQLTASTPLSSEQLAQAESLISALEQLATNQLDPQAAIVNILSPVCATQMQQRANQYSNNCVELNINSIETASMAKESTVAELCEGRAVGVSICTGFFKATTAIDSKFCEDDNAGIDDHNFHAVTLIGYRSGPNGRRQFLIQNSWGNTCPFRKHVGGVPAALKDLVECESKSDTDSSSTGRFWVDEDLLFNNTYQLSTYRP